MTIASKPHIPFLWRIILRLGSSSSCCAWGIAKHNVKFPGGAQCPNAMYGGLYMAFTRQIAPI